MFAFFNSFQIVLLFAVAPFAIQYVHTAEFSGHTVLFWTMLVGYIIGFYAMCMCVYSTAMEIK